MLAAICARAEEWPLALGWLPILADPDDEPFVQLARTPPRPTMAERAARVNWEKVDAILARVPNATPTPGDEL